MSTTLKHRLFVSEPMGNKSVRCLPGIGESRASKLEQQDFNRADAVLGQFLRLNRDRQRFTNWLKDASGANIRQAGLCYDCLGEWCDNNL
ncbi:barrier-to-autointegration factor B-like isoform X1 [Sebastes umbrosus]|uniref:barrier-to-autointegration factor B-like isoform X1 n=1 Tax=Sebastes umbrosus TaxID=72105 RepID=UPI00189D6698|nr:barrier-to-autointegration factor B-like isoform X1 [Sebastes umbrosus]XP_037638137.1 barrier-to-autointegration factor B-like isoform X1 [Sebastes umbrosus]XP_037638139.1 barrier-to-autointegration factor B-like isoform X1 [Sebastes umbrosus]